MKKLKKAWHHIQCKWFKNHDHEFVAAKNPKKFPPLDLLCKHCGHDGAPGMFSLRVD